MDTITKVALSNNKKNKTRSLLIMSAIFLTTTLLVIISTFASGMIRLQQENAASTYGSQYGMFLAIDGVQLQELQRRSEIQEIGIMSTAGILKGNEKGGFVSTDEAVRSMLPHNQEYLLESGAYPEGLDEIAASRAFFEAEGYQNVSVGDKVSLYYRSGMSDEYKQKEFVVSGILCNREYYQVDASYIVFCSSDFYENQFHEQERQYNVYFTLNDSVDVSMNNIDEALMSIATSCGIDTKKLMINDYYLSWTLEPSYEMIAVCGILIVGLVLFSVVVIYNIFQVGIAQKIQEYGKIKALGATKRQMRRLIFKEGMILAVIAIPFGLIVGFVIAKGSFGWLVEQGNKVSQGLTNSQIPLFSLPMLLISTAISLITVILALRKPMKIVANISPIEATRYLDNRSHKNQGIRKGRRDVTVFSMTMANVTGNKKRTVGTILTMGLSCVLFVIISNCIGNIDTEYEARKGLNHGQFELKLDYSLEWDEAYPENNLDSILRENPLNQSLIDKIKQISGVTDVITREIVVASANGSHQVISIVNKEDFESLRSESDIGNMNYEEAVKNKNIFFGWSMWMQADGYALDKPISLQLENGVSTFTYNGNIAGAFGSAYTYWLMPEEVYHSLQSTGSSIGYLWIDCNQDDVAYVEQELKNLMEDTSYVRFRTYHDELETAEFASRMMKLGCYLFMAIIGLIGFMNLANTMIINITTKKQEYGVLQAVGMTNRQLNRSLQMQGLLFTVSTIIVALGVGLPLGYGLFSYMSKNGFFGINVYHVPVVPILVMIAVITGLQAILSFILSHNLKKETLVERIRYQG